MVDAIEVLFDIGIHYPVVAGIGRFPDRFQRLLGTFPRTESVTTLLEIRLEDRFDHEFRRRLYHSVPDCRNSQGSFLSVGLGNVVSTDRRRPILSRPKILLNFL